MTSSIPKAYFQIGDVKMKKSNDDSIEVYHDHLFGHDRRHDHRDLLVYRDPHHDRHVCPDHHHDHRACCDHDRHHDRYH